VKGVLLSVKYIFTIFCSGDGDDAGGTWFRELRVMRCEVLVCVTVTRRAAKGGQ
jgi:hypothetical protein